MLAEWSDVNVLDTHLEWFGLSVRQLKLSYLSTLSSF